MFYRMVFVTRFFCFLKRIFKHHVLFIHSRFQRSLQRDIMTQQDYIKVEHCVMQYLAPTFHSHGALVFSLFYIVGFCIRANFSSDLSANTFDKRAGNFCDAISKKTLFPSAVHHQPHPLKFCGGPPAIFGRGIVLTIRRATSIKPLRRGCLKGDPRCRAISFRIYFSSPESSRTFVPKSPSGRSTGRPRCISVSPWYLLPVSASTYVISLSMPESRTLRGR